MKNVEMEKTELQKILQSYKLSSPLDNDVKKYIRDSMGKQFKKIIKKSGDYDIFTGLSLSIFFFIKKNGILLSILKLFSSAILFSTITYGSYLVYDICINNSENEILEKDEKIKIDSVNKSVKQIQETYYYSKKLSLKAIPFSEQNVSSDIANEVSITFKRELAFNKVTTLKNKFPGANFLLTGSLMKLDNRMVLFVKVINVNTSEIVYTSSNKVDSREELLKVSKSVAKEIPGHLIR